MKTRHIVSLLAAALMFASCGNDLTELPVLTSSAAQSTGSTDGTPSVPDETDPVGGLTVVVKSVDASRQASRAITGVKKMVINLESSTYPSLNVTATENNGTFTARIPGVKAGKWTVKASLFDADGVEKYYGTAQTDVLWNVANRVTLSVAATGSVGVDVVEDTTGYRVAAPTISPNVSTMIESFYASIDCASSGAEIRFTVDGSDPTPTHGYRYTSSIRVDRCVTFKAIAYKDGFKDSPVTTKTFELRVPALYTSITAGPYLELLNVTNADFSIDSQYLTDLGADGITLMYTLDGTEPSFANGVTKLPSPLPANTVLKAAAVKSGWVSSNVITINVVYDFTVPQIKTSIPVGPYATVLDLSNKFSFVNPSLKPLGTGNFALRYTVDGSDPSFSNGLTAPPELKTPCTLKVAGVRDGYKTSNILTIDVKYAFKATLDANGGTGTVPTVAAVNTALPSSFTLPTAKTLSVLRKDTGLTERLFGWCTTSDGTGTIYKLGDTIDAPQGSVTLYAYYRASVGDAGPAGGYISYVKDAKSDGWQYMECAPKVIGTCVWIDDSSGTLTLTANSEKEYLGLENCAAINYALSASQRAATGAVKLCMDYSLGGYDDWFLPSKIELDGATTALARNGVSTYGEYWTSTVSGTYALRRELTKSYSATAWMKFSSTQSVIPVRRF